MLAQPETLFDEITDFLVAAPTPREIIAFKPSAPLDERLHELLERKADDGLSNEEEEELDRFLHLNHLLTLLKAKARLRTIR